MKTAIFTSWVVAFAFGWATIETFPEFWLWFDGDVDANMAAYYFLFAGIVMAIGLFALADYNLAKPVRIKSSDIKYIQVPRNSGSARNKYGFPNNIF